MTAEHSPDLAHDQAAEQAVIGIVLAHPDGITEARQALRAEDFYTPHHQVIFDTAVRLDSAGDPVEPAALISALTRSGDLHRIPGEAGYLTDLYADAPPVASLGHYAKKVRDAAIRRDMATLGARMQQEARITGSASPAEMVERMRNHLDTLAVERLGSDIPLARDILDSALNEIDRLSRGEAVVGIPTGFTDLDRYLNGLSAGQMITIAARPGAGKSSLAMDLARHAALRLDKHVLIFNLEMSAQEVLTRALACEAYVDLQSLKTGKLDEQAWANLARASEKIQNSMLAIDDTATVTMAEIRAKARAFERSTGRLDMIVIDYLQLMNADHRSDSRQQEVSEISRGVKLLAKEFKIPVIVLSQLNRSSEQRADKRPQIADLRESGAIEQDSDVVILIHREEMSQRESPRAGEADVIIAKQRSGPTGEVVLSWLAKYTRFANLALD